MDQVLGLANKNQHRRDKNNRMINTYTISRISHNKGHLKMARVYLAETLRCVDNDIYNNPDENNRLNKLRKSKYIDNSSSQNSKQNYLYMIFCTIERRLTNMCLSRRRIKLNSNSTYI